MQLFVRFLVLALTLATWIAAPRAQTEPTAESQRLARIDAIARSLQDPASDAVSLFTEAARLAGFTIRSEERALLAEPLATPGLRLALTDAEIRAYTQMFRDGHSVSLADLLAAIDHLWNGMGVDASCEPFVGEWRRSGFRTGAASSRALLVLLQALGSHGIGDAGCIDRDGDVELDPLQALLLVRVLTEDLLLPLRRAIESGAVPDPAVAPTDRPRRGGPSRDTPHATTAAIDWPGWAEDGFAGTVTTLVGKGVENIEKIGKKVAEFTEKTGLSGDKLGKGLGYANAISSLAKCIATYTFLRGEVRVDDPGQPLVRTKTGPSESDAGERRTLVARFWIDGSKVTDWMKDNRPLVTLTGLDIDMPKSGALKGIETEWQIAQDRHSSKHHLIQTVRGQPDISKIRTDDNGEARIRVEGRPQPKSLHSTPVLPVEKQVAITVWPQVKSTEMQQDLVDAVFGALGIVGIDANTGGTFNPLGILTPVIESLYRMKWKGGRKFVLHVRDWVAADVVGTAEITIKATGADFRRDSGFQVTYDRSLAFRDVELASTEIDVPAFDDSILRFLPPAQREQVLEGRRQLEQLAAKPSFHSQERGRAELRIRDRESGYGEEGECDPKPLDYATTWTADLATDLAEPSAGLRMLIIDLDLPKRTATVRVMLTAIANVHAVKRVGGKSTTKQYEEEIGIFTGLTFAAPFDRNVVLPLVETQNVVTGGVDLYGVATIPFRFGPGERFQGTAQISYTISKRPKGERR